MPIQPPTIIANDPIPVDERESLWRYVSLPGLLLYLSSQLRLSSVQELRRMDPQEGIPSWDDVAQADAFSSDEYQFLKNYVISQLSPAAKTAFLANANYPCANQQVIFRRWRQLVAETRYALCFFVSPHESIAMWRLFAPKGFAIRTSLPHLVKALQSTHRKWRISRMKYWNKSEEITADLTHSDELWKKLLRYPHFLKSREYEYENEVRLCTVDAQASPNLIVRWVSPEDWIQEIRISPDLWYEDAEILRKLIMEHFPAVKDRIGNSPLTKTPSITDSFESQLVGDCNKISADENWPAFLHDP